ncbi:uracil-DNA glycosylase [Pseudarthrobacter equi]|uniref:uracil-DNA glycosylase n=1 Tax=Pseudarthrobacter equi TaxID=728066 RepID=UPI00389A6C5A
MRAHLKRTALGNLVLIGEAAGWRGARQSGVAFTSAPDAGLAGTREASATVVQGVLEQSGLAATTLLWNALPAHPHKVGAPMTNRTPTNRELAIGENALSIAIDSRFVICVGQKAARAVSAVLDNEVRGISASTPSIRALAIRHPSFGGASQFRKEFAACLTHWNF